MLQDALLSARARGSAFASVCLLLALIGLLAEAWFTYTLLLLQSNSRNAPRTVPLSRARALYYTYIHISTRSFAPSLRTRTHSLTHLVPTSLSLHHIASSHLNLIVLMIYTAIRHCSLVTSRSLQVSGLMVAQVSRTVVYALYWVIIPNGSPASRGVCFRGEAELSASSRSGIGGISCRGVEVQDRLCDLLRARYDPAQEWLRDAK